MPTISAFYGISIQMFFHGHLPPHFHARYGEFVGTIEIERQILLKGSLPPRALNLVCAWAQLLALTES